MLILAGVGNDFEHLVDAIDAYVAVAVLRALDEPFEPPF
jgi:hypothetical protein